MLFLIPFVGFIAAVIAAAPPGAANIAVINTTIKTSAKKARPLMLGAGFGEMAIALLTLHCTSNFSQFFQEHLWVQALVFCLFIIIGLALLVKKYITFKRPKFKFNVRLSSFTRGFLFAFMNPPVLIFWLIAFAFIRMHAFQISEMSMISTLILFFLGIFAGKVTTLYAYATWGKKMEKRSPNSKNKVYTFVGIALVIVGIIQAIKFSYF